MQQTINTAKSTGALQKCYLDKVNVDTPVREKAATFPTDAKLYDKMPLYLVAEAGEEGIKLRQSYVRLGKQALLMQRRYAHAWVCQTVSIAVSVPEDRLALAGVD